MNISSLTTAQLAQALSIREKIEALQLEIDAIAGGGRAESAPPAAEEAPKKGKRSAAVRAKMAAAQRARWAKLKGEAETDAEPSKPKRKLSPAHKRKLIKALAKARKVRLAKLKAEGGIDAEPKKRKMSAAGRAAISAAAKARWAKAKSEGKSTL